MIYDAVFYILAVIVVGSACVVALSRNIIRSAFAMVITFIGIAGLFILLSADFLAVTQLLVYVGGILVLFLFAIMLSSRIEGIKVSNRSIGLFSGSCLVVLVIWLLVYISIRAPWKELNNVEFTPTTANIGNQLLSTYLLPFEVLSILLLVGLIGAVVIAKKEKEPS